MVFHGFWLVSMVFKVVSWFFMVFGWFPWFFKVVSWFFIVFGWFPWFFKVVSWFFMVFGWFPWFFKVVSWFLLGFHDYQCAISIVLTLSKSGTLYSVKKYVKFRKFACCTGILRRTQFKSLQLEKHLNCSQPTRVPTIIGV